MMFAMQECHLRDRLAMLADSLPLPSEFCHFSQKVLVPAYKMAISLRFTINEQIPSVGKDKR